MGMMPLGVRGRGGWCRCRVWHPRGWGFWLVAAGLVG